MSIGQSQPVSHSASGDEIRTVWCSLAGDRGEESVESELIFSEVIASATVGIWRFASEGRSAVLKVLRHGEGGSPNWRSGEDVGHWYYWRREALAYSSGLLDHLAGPLRAPRCLGVFERPDNSVGIWMEDLAAGTPAAAWDLARYRSASHALGVAQGASVAAGEEPPSWVARGWLRQYVERRQPFLAILDDSVAWDQPLVAAHLPAQTRSTVLAIWEARDELLGEVEAAPRCLCHNDLHPGNMFSLGDDPVVIDWAFAGWGHLGEDAANLIFDAVWDFFVPPQQLQQLQQAVTEGYLEGLVSSGFAGDTGQVRRCVAAFAAVKFFWIPLAMVETISSGRQTINRRPLEEGLAWWAPVVPRIFEAAQTLGVRP